MAETYPSDTELNALSGTSDAEQAVAFPTIGDSPYYTSFYKMLYRLLDVARRSGDLRVYKDGDLTFGVRAGRYINGDAAVNYAGASEQALTNDATNYVYLTAAGSLTKNTTGFPVPSVTPHIPLATIATGTASAAAVSGEYNHADMIDYRGRGAWSVCGAAGGGVNALDWQESVADRDLTAPPGSPALGDRYIVAAGGSGAWSGLDGHIVQYNGTSWTDIAPTEGAVTLVEDEDILVGYNGSAWVDLGSFANICDLTDGGNADALHVHTVAGLSDISATAANLNEAGTFFNATDISGPEAETLTDASNADALHVHTVAGLSDISATAANLNEAGTFFNTTDISGAEAETLTDNSSATGLHTHPRSNIETEASVRYQIPLMSWRDFDGSAMKVAGESPTTSDFYIVAPGMGAGTRYIRGADAISNTKTSTTQREFCLPPEYVAGTDIELKIHIRYTGAGTAGTKTIDAEVYELTDAGAVGADLNGDAIEDMTASFADTAGFTIDGSGLVAGDMLMIVIQAVLQETVGSDTIHVEIGSIELQLGIKG